MGFCKSLRGNPGRRVSAIKQPRLLHRVIDVSCFLDDDTQPYSRKIEPGEQMIKMQFVFVIFLFSLMLVPAYPQAVPEATSTVVTNEANAQKVNLEVTSNLTPAQMFYELRRKRTGIVNDISKLSTKKISDDQDVRLANDRLNSLNQNLKNIVDQITNINKAVLSADIITRNSQKDINVNAIDKLKSTPGSDPEKISKLVDIN